MVRDVWGWGVDVVLVELFICFFLRQTTEKIREAIAGYDAGVCLMIFLGDDSKSGGK
jgi:hypothetical protein